MSVKRSLGAQIERAMRAKGWKARGAELARRYNEKYPDAHVREQTVGAWLKGRRLPNAANLQGLNGLLEVELDVSSAATRVAAGRVKEPVVKAYAADPDDNEAWQAFLTLGRQRRKLVRELIHALAPTRAE